MAQDDNMVSQFVNYVSSFFQPAPVKSTVPKPAPPRAAPQPHWENPEDIPKPTLQSWIEGAGFNEMSTRRLMEVNPRLALIAVEAKVAFDRDPANEIRDRAGHVTGHKTFQVQANGGFRTVRDQSGPTGAGNSDASPSRFQSHHQWGEAVDFWIYNHTNATATRPASEAPTEDTAAEHPYYERMADKAAGARNARAIGVTRDDLRITLNGSPDWGHLELPERVRGEWHRAPTTGMVVVDGRTVPNTGIDPDLHPRPGRSYSLLRPS